MEKVLTQDEINALLHAAQTTAASSAGAAPARKYTPFVFGKASRISKQQVSDVSQIHETFAYRLKNRLSAYLQATIEINPMSVDEVPYAEFTQHLPANTYLASINIHPSNSIGILSLDLPVAFTMIELMLGGDGKGSPPERHTTEIEERVLQTVVDMICDELQMAWRQVIEVNFVFDQTQRPAELFRLLPSYEKILFLSFEVRMPEVFSTLTLAFPAAVSSILLRKLARKSARNLGSSQQSKGQIKDRIRECVFRVDLLLPPTRIRGKDLLELNDGQTIMIGHRLNRPAVLKVAGTKMFAGYPVRSGKQRGAKIHQKFAVPFPRERVTE
ncbi:MAG: flagellar motor switch protein FliM [Terriglobia bacterium]